MSKTLFLLLSFAFFSVTILAQSPEPVLKHNDKGWYVEHKVAAKENYYSIGRLYNAPPKEIAAINALDMNKGLSIGQVIRIPLNSTNFSQSVDEGAPVYYKAGEKESLEKISSQTNNVPVENLRRWNGLQTNVPAAGTRIIVGFLLASQLPSITIVERDFPKPVQVIEEKKPDVEVVKLEPKKEVTVKNDPPPVKTETRTTVPVNNSEGFFKNMYDQQLKAHPATKSETVTSGIFRTSSGWSDAKYYVLIDGVAPGTIIRIANPGNNKTIYAKVLGEMSGIRQNEGLNIRMSNAAASTLQVTEQDKFIVKIAY
jgi:LysM repeat protein